MKLSEIQNQINRDIDDSYDNTDLTEWINRGIDDLTPIAKKEASTTLTNPYALPSDVHEIVYVIQDGQTLQKVSIDDQFNTGYKVWGDSLKLQHLNGNPIDLYYFKRLNKLVNPDDVPGIEEEFHDLLILYALGNIQYHDEDYEDRPDALNRYEKRKEEYKQFIQRKRSRGRVNTKVVW